MARNQSAVYVVLLIGAAALAGYMVARSLQEGVPVLASGTALPQPRPAWPHLEAWYAQVLARPATQGVLDLPIS